MARLRLLGIMLALGGWVAPDAALGQGVTRIASDGSLPGTERVDIPGVNGLFEIPETLGWRPGGGTNLFHSFEFFDVAALETALFTADSGLSTRHVLARVTGGAPSFIEGRLASLIPDADLWFMNPSGVLFGPGASLDVPASFHATTADLLGFADGSRFTADPALDAAAGSVLDVAAPPDFGLLGAPMGFGFTSEAPAALTVDRAFLEVPEGRTLSLVGGNVLVVGDGQSFGSVLLLAPGGRIQLASAASPGEVVVRDGGDASDLDAGSVAELGEVVLANGAVVDVGGAGGGRVLIRGGFVQLVGALVLADAFGGAPGGGPGIDVEGDELLIVGGAIAARASGDADARDIELRSGRLTVDGQAQILALAERGSTGKGGSLTIMAGELVIQDGSLVDVSTFADGDGGDLRVTADRMVVADGSAVFVVTDGGAGHAGDLTLRVGSLELLNARIAPGAFGPGTGDAGDTLIEAEQVRLLGASILSSQSAAAASGDGGDMIVVTRLLEMEEGSALDSTTFGAGDGGDLTIEAETILVSGKNAPISESGAPIGTLISSQAGSGSSGRAGNLKIDADTLIVDGRGVLGGAFVDASTQGTGEGGELAIDVRQMEVVGGGVVSVGTLGPGAAGALLIRADTLRLADGAQLSSQSEGPGDGGVLEVVAGEVEVSGGAGLSAGTFSSGRGGDVSIQAGRVSVRGSGSNINAQAGPGSTGDAGSIALRADEIELDDGSRVDVTTFGAGSGGVLDIEAGTLEIRGGSQVQAATACLAEDCNGATGSAGELHVDAAQIRIVGDDAAPGPSGLFASSEPGSSGAAGLLTVRASGSLLLEGNARIDSRTSGGAGGDVALEAGGDVTLSNGALVTATSRGAADAGNVTVRAGRDLTLSSGSRIATEAAATEGGDVALAAGRRLTLSGGSSISASVDGGDGGSVRVGGAQVLVLRDGSSITAQAREPGGSGGRIEIRAASVFVEHPLGPPPYERAPQAGDSFIDASAPGGPEAQGQVLIESPVVEVVEQATPLDTHFLDAAAQLQPSCAARAARGESGSFAVARHRGLPAAPDEVLIAYDEIAPPPAPDPALARGLPDVAGAPHALAPVEAVEVAEASLASGAGAFRGGHFERAAEEQARAAELLAREQDPAAALDAVRALAQSQLALGRYVEAAASLEQARPLADRLGDPARMLALETGLGNAYLGMGRQDLAEEHLERASVLARESGDSVQGARLQNNLGNLRAARRRHSEALDAYAQSARLAAEAQLPVEESKALSNAARAALEAGAPARAKELLARARSRAGELPASHQKASVWIHVAASYEGLASAASGEREAALLAAHEVLTSAAALARDLEEPRALSSALGQLGGLYAAEHRAQEALHLTRTALRAAEEANAVDLAYRWHWQEGRILWAEGRAAAALRSYRRAVEIVEETRQETLAQYGSAQTRFPRRVAPVYLDFIDALLESSDLVQEPADSERLLVEARRVMERFHAAELRDYFRDECVAEIQARAVDLDRIARSAAAAIVYPIVLPDRLELLLSLPSGVARHSLEVPESRVRETLAAYRQGVSQRGSFDFVEPAQRLYDWLVRPYLDRLESEGVRTLVFVPHGELRTVPLAALHDGEEYLVARYAVAVTPGLSLVDPRSLDPEGARLLLAGISESIQGFPELPHAVRELEAIHELYGGEVLLNEAFAAKRFESELAAEQPTVVHVASHAVFTGDPSESFLLTYDGRLSMDAISEAFAPTRFREQPVELLTLSACETAVGDERAALGLAGVAIRAGARSALGSLWRIEDEATYRLIVSFYEQLREPGVSKAEALRRAQLELRRDLRFAHPFYWSPFLLISNWL